MGKKSPKVNVVVEEVVVVEEIKTQEVVEVVENVTLEVKRPPRKKQVWSIIVRDQVTTTEKISKELGISRRNVSSVLCYLKADGKKFETGVFGLECRIYCQ